MAPPSDRTLMQAETVACTRGGRLLFTGLSCRVGAGESLLLTGPNGVGKSSLIRLIAGLLPPFSGKLTRLCPVALADERSALDPGRRLADALGFWARMEGVDPSRVTDAADRLALTPLLAMPVRMLSTGQRKRAALARVIASPAPLWLLDEPGNGLDAHALAALGDAIDAHLATGGAVVAASHLDLPHRFAARIDLAELAP